MSEPSERDKLLHYLFTTALEGGIVYWSQCSRYHWMIGPPAHDVERPSEEDWRGFYAEIVEVGDGDDEEPHRIDRSVVSRGLRLAAMEPWRNKIRWSSGEKPPLVVTDDTDWDFDAGDADMIVQLGLFGEVVYG